MRWLVLLSIFSMASVLPAKTFAFGPGPERLGLGKSYQQVSARVFHERIDGKLRSIARIIDESTYGKSERLSEFRKRLHDTVILPLGWERLSGQTVNNFFGKSTSLSIFQNRRHKRYLLTMAFVSDTRPHLLTIESVEQARLDSAMANILEESLLLRDAPETRHEKLTAELGASELSLIALEVPFRNRVAIALLREDKGVAFRPGEVKIAFLRQEKESPSTFLRPSAFALSHRGGGLAPPQEAKWVALYLDEREIARASILAPLVK